MLAGLLGVGGGIIIVPILYHLLTGFEVDASLAMPLAVGTSLSTIVFTSLVSARKHYAKGGVDMQLVRSWWPALLLGVVLGSLLPNVLDGVLVKQVFGVMLILVAVHMLLGSFYSLQLTEQLPGRFLSQVLAMLIGGFSALLGIGGGTLVVPTLSSFGVVIHRAVSTAALFGVLISIPATLVYIVNGWNVPGLPDFSSGYVNWLAFVILVPMTMAFAPLGVKLAYRLNVAQLKRAFAVFLCVVGIKMALF